ncbi:MAG TPA: hypothetical protein VGI92_03800, partial [Gemmatimonadales bacterium]
VLHGFGQLTAYFIRNFASLNDGSRLIVAPEALNRFYLDNTTYHGSPQARVGATWMTREDRQAEIDDYVNYLDLLHHQIAAQLGGAKPRTVVLGFSQGVATACRWLARGTSRADTLVLWAGPMPIELDAAASAPLRPMRIIRVLGRKDQIGSPEAIRAEDARYAAMNITAELVQFDGGHEIDEAALLALRV